MGTNSSRVFAHFHRIGGGHVPAPFRSRSLFGRPAAHSDSSHLLLAEEVKRLASDLGEQGAVLSGIGSAISGGGTSSLEKAAAPLTGPSLLGALAGSASHGFSWTTVLKEVLPFGGLISDVTNLFRSAHVPAPLQRYDAPAPLGFSGVLGSNGQISQGSSGASGFTRSSGSGLDLKDAAGGPEPAYARRADGSLGEVAGPPASRYAGVLDLSSNIQALVNPAGVSGQPRAAFPGTPAAANDAPAERARSLPAEPGAAAAYDGPKLPSFDSSWFMDHAPYIAAAVRIAMLDSHPILDVINDL